MQTVEWAWIVGTAAASPAEIPERGTTSIGSESLSRIEIQNNLTDQIAVELPVTTTKANS